MTEYVCSVCGFIYNEESSEKDHAGKPIPFTNLDPDWVCPNCGVTPDLFDIVEKVEI